MNEINRMIIEDFRKERDNFIKLGDIVEQKLEKICKDTGIVVMAITHRVKSEESLAGKLVRSGDWYQKMQDLTDLLGARVICYFQDQVDIIGKRIEEEFEINKNLSSDKRALIGADTFGYISLHYTCRLKEKDGYDKSLSSKYFEIQIRTNLQHTWSEIEHDLGYKSQYGVPREIVRAFARIAGLLEIADDEFVRVRDFMENYTKEIKEKIRLNEASEVAIDRISLREYMHSNVKMREFIEKLSNLCGTEIREIDPESYIEQLMWLKVSTLGELENILEKNYTTALWLAEQTLKYTDLNIVSSTVALYYLLRAELIRKSYSQEKVVDFLILATNSEKRAKRQAKRLFDLAKSMEKSRELNMNNSERYNEALKFAAQKHEGQFRIGGKPYITHPGAVAEYLLEAGYNEDYQITGLFHDLLEDTDATEDEILKYGGEAVLEAVKLLTKTEGYVMEDYVKGIRENPMAFAVKGADRLHNLRCAVCTDDSFKARYIIESKKWYMEFNSEIPKAVEHLRKSMDNPIDCHIDDYNTMQVEKLIEGSLTVITPKGRIDGDNLSRFEDALNTSLENTTDLIVDLKHLEYISSAGLKVLLMALKIMNKKGSMKLVNVGDNIMNVFDITGFSDILTIE